MRKMRRIGVKLLTADSNAWLNRARSVLLGCEWFKLAGVPFVMEGQQFSLDTECAISYYYLLPRPVVVCIFAFMPEEHGKK
jgi:hypothetical protein